MFCPQCKAEYRPGFTRCADCDVDLVHESQELEVSRQRWEADLQEKWRASLWRGLDPHFYLSLMSSLSAMRVPCFGRSANPPIYETFEDQPAGSFVTVEFEIRVPESDLAFAQWILRSSKELYDEKEVAAETNVPSEGDEKSEASPDVTGVCPLCDAEFTATDSLCPNCGVPLRPPRSGSTDHDPVKQLTNLRHPQFQADLWMALQRARIPFNNANFPEGPDSLRTNILVPHSDFERATNVMAQVLQYWQFDRSFFLSPSHDPRESYWPKQAKDNGWYPEDFSLQIWSGTNLWLLDGVGLASREHRIAYRVEIMKPGSGRVFVHPEDEASAREVVRAVVDGAPLE